MTAWVSGRFSQLVPSRSTRYGIASMRRPSTPISSQKRMALSTSSIDQRVVEVQIRLVREEAVPVVGLRGLIPGPVGFFGVRKDDARVLVALIGVGPDIHVALRRAGGRKPRGFEPRMLIAGVVDDQLDHDLHAALMRGFKEGLEIGRACRRRDLHRCSSRCRSHRRAAAKGRTAGSRCR